MKFRIALFLVCIILIIPGFTDAQCSMCRAVGETNLQSGEDFFAGLNNGIVYLMGIPYLLIIVVGVVIFRFRKNAIEANLSQ